MSTVSTLMTPFWRLVHAPYDLLKRVVAAKDVVRKKRLKFVLTKFCNGMCMSNFR